MKTNMADNSGPSQAISPNSDGGNDDKEKEKKMSDIMQILYARSGRQRSWNDTIKALRANTEKRQQTEAYEKVMLQKYLDTLQKACRVNSLTLMLERLEMLARHIGMQCTREKDSLVYLNHDLIHMEIQLEFNGVAKDVKIKHIQDFQLQSCPDMVTALNDGDFEEFQKHCEGLIAITQIGNDKKTRSKCFMALNALESDLNTLVQYQSSITGTSNYIHKSPLGIVQPRSGGYPLKMTYFVHPYDLLDEKSERSLQMSLNTVRERKLGCHVSLGLEASSPHRLQNMPLLSFVKTHDGKSLPSFAQTTNMTSSQVPAVFVLKLHKPTPLSLSIIRKIKNTTGVDVPMSSKTLPLLHHLVKLNCKSKKYDYSKGLYVTVPDQNHCYFMNCASNSDDLQGAMVSKIPFAHPANVAKILIYLRQQMLFNTLISSCIRSNPKQDLGNSMTFEVMPMSLQHVVVTFEHPANDSIATAEIFLHEVTNVQCQISSMGANSTICPEEFASKVLQRCLSLPLTMRAILKKATADLGLIMVQSPLPSVPITPRTLSKLGQDHRHAFVDPHNKQYGSQVSVGSAHSDIGKETVTAISSGFMDPAMAPVDVLEAYKAEKIQRNPMLASLLDSSDKAAGNSAETQQQPSMLSALLEHQPPPPAKPKRPRKRRSMSDQRSPGSSAKSPKRRALDDDMGSGSNLSSVEVSPSQSTTGFEPSPSHSSGVSTPVTSHSTLAGLIAEESFSQVSPMTKLATTVDSIKHEPKSNLPSEGFGGSDGGAQPMRVKEESSNKDEGPRKKLMSGSCLADLLESPKCEANNVFFGSKDRSNSTSDLSSSSSSVHSKSVNDNRHDKGSPYEFKPDPVLNDSSYSSKIKSEQLSSNSYNHERSSSTSKSSSDKLNSAQWDGKSDSVLSKSEDKVKDRIKKEKKESNSDDKPHEREKITVKLNTKELTAKTSVKERSSSPHDIELTKSHSREGKSSKESSKSNREKMYDISSDNSLPSSLVITRPLLQEGGRSNSPSLKIKKIRTEDGKGEKKRKSSKHVGESSKRKREDGKKDKSKKRKVYNDSDISDRPGSDRYSAVEKGPTTIKITTKMQLQSSKLSSPIKSSKSLSSSNPSGLKSIKADRLSMSPQGSKSKSSIKALNRSKSETQGLSLGRNYDSKLNKTPTIKLKPLVMPNSATSINISSKGSSSPGSAPSKSSSDLKSKLSAGPKSRKPLDDIVDKLKTKQGTTPGSVLQFKPRDGGEKKDAITKRNELDEVRKAIIQQGIKPSGTTKELTSYRAGPSMRPTKLSLDGNKRSEMKGSGTPTNPIPKISQNLNKSSPASSTSKLGTIPKTSNASSNGNNSDYSSSKSNSVSGNYGSSSLNSSGGGSSDYSIRDSGGMRVSGQSSSEGSTRMKLSNSNNSHGPSDNTSRTENSDSKRESKDVSSASSASYSSAAVSLSHGNSASSTSSSTVPGSSNSAAASYSASPSNASAAAAATSTSSFQSSSNSTLSSSSGSQPTAPLSSSSSSALSATTSVTNSGSGKDQVKDSDKNRKRSVDDISERLLSRHFLDAVTKFEDGGDEDKKGSSKSASDGRTDFTELPDKVRPNGYNKSDRLNDSWSGKEDGRDVRSTDGSSDYLSSGRPNCVDSPVPSRTDRRGHSSVEDKENSMSRDEDSVFRAPTPKGSKSGVEVTEDRLEPRARSDSRTKPVLSPRSDDVSSPEDSLVIDCPGTPKSVRSPSINRTEKIVSKPTTPVNCSDAAPHSKNSSSSAVSRTPQSPSPHKLKASPCLSPATKSPAMIAHSPGPSPDTNSQVDDDLMNVALGLSSTCKN